MISPFNILDLSCIVAVVAAAVVFFLTSVQLVVKYNGKDYSFPLRTKKRAEVLRTLMYDCMVEGAKLGAEKGYEMGFEKARELFLKIIEESGEGGRLVKSMFDFGRQAGFSEAMSSVEELDFDELLKPHKNENKDER